MKNVVKMAHSKIAASMDGYNVLGPIKPDSEGVPAGSIAVDMASILFTKIYPQKP